MARKTAAESPEPKPKRTSRKKAVEASPSPLDLLNGVQVAPATEPGGRGFFPFVDATVKGAKFHLPLDPCTAIVGGNRAGKTRVLDAVRLAITGKHPIGRSGADLAELGLAGQPPEARVGNQKVIDALPKGDRERLLPSISTGELLRMGPSLLREALFKRFHGSLKLDLTPPATLSEDGKRAFTMLVAKPDPVVALGTAIAQCRSDVLNLGKQQAIVAGNIAQFTAQVAAVGLVGDDEESRLVEALARAGRTDGGAELRSQLHARKQVIQNGLPTLVQLYMDHKDIPNEAPERGDIVRLQVELRHAQADRDAAQMHTGQAREALARVEAALRFAEAAETAQHCPVCGTANPPGAHAQVVALTAVAAERRAAVAQKEAEDGAIGTAVARLEAQLVAERAANAQAHSEKVRTREALREKLTTIRKELEQTETNLTTLGAPAEPVGNLDVPATEQRLAQIRALRTVEAQLKAAREQEASLARQAAELGSLATAFSVVADGIMAALRGAVELAVNCWMPPNFTAQLVTGDGVCHFAVLGTDGKPHPQHAMSGAEHGTLALALALAWSEDLPYRVLLLDDADLAGWSGDNVRLVLGTIADWQHEGRITQAIVAWSREDEVPDGWLVHRIAA